MNDEPQRPTDQAARAGDGNLPPLEEALKRAYYYDEACNWRDVETTDEWDRWHAVATVALAAAPAVSAPAWQPIETAPKDGRSILLFEKYEDVPIVGYWWTNRGWRADKSVYDTDGDACVIDKICQEGVTHWMPLPAAPAFEAPATAEGSHP